MGSTSKISKFIRQNKELHVKLEGNVNFEVTRGQKMQKKNGETKWGKN